MNKGKYTILVPVQLPTKRVKHSKRKFGQRSETVTSQQSETLTGEIF